MSIVVLKPSFPHREGSGEAINGIMEVAGEGGSWGHTRSQDS